MRNKKRYYMTIALLLLLIFPQLSFGGDYPSTSPGNDYQKLSSNRPKLNLSIILDLSDRISTKIHPNSVMEVYQRDLGYVNAITNAFVTHCLNKKVITLSDKMQVFLDPPPANSEINKLVTELKVDVNRNTATREYLTNIEETYARNLQKVYDLSITSDNYPGADIWRFFKSRVKDYCVEDGCENILVILTDGYLYHDKSVMKEDNRTSYLTSNTVRSLGLTSSKWEEKFDQQNLGFIAAQSGLGNLRVLVLGISPNESNPYEEDVIRKYWSKWFNEMGIEKSDFKTLDLPVNLKGSIQSFIWNE